MNTCKNTSTKRIKRNRRLTRGGGISIPIVMALVVAASLAIAVYFIASFMGLGFAVGGTPQYNVNIKQLSTTGFQISIKNIGSVAITKAELKILDGITNKVIYNATIDFKKGAFSATFNTTTTSSTTPEQVTCSGTSSSGMIVNQGQSAVVTCAVGSGCTLTVSGYSNSVSLTTCEAGGTTVTVTSYWPPQGLIAGRPYKIVVILHFANGQVREWSTTITAVT